MKRRAIEPGPPSPLPERFSPPGYVEDWVFSDEVVGVAVCYVVALAIDRRRSAWTDWDHANPGSTDTWTLRYVKTGCWRIPLFRDASAFLFGDASKNVTPTSLAGAQRSYPGAHL